MGKFDKYFYEFPIVDEHWYGMVTPRGFLRGNREMKTCNLTIDFTVLTKPQPMDIPHFHPIDEYILFVGSDFKNFYEFEDEIEFWIGDDPEKMERVPIKQSSIIRVPAGMYHAPTYFKTFDTPINGSALYPHGDFRAVHRRVNENGFYEYTYTGDGIRPCEKNPKVKCTYCGKCFAEKMAIFETDESGKPSKELIEHMRPYYEMAEKNQTHQFDKYIYPFKPVEIENPNLLTPRAGFRGAEEIEGAKVCFMFDIVKNECELGDLHMHPANEEYLFFFGSDIKEFFSFDAEIEIDIGDDPANMETHVITKPTVLQIPEGTWHGPVKFKKVGAPITYLPMYMSGRYGKVVKENGLNIYKDGGIPE